MYLLVRLYINSLSLDFGPTEIAIVTAAGAAVARLYIYIYICTYLIDDTTGS